MRILWVSRHEILLSQRRELERLFGLDVDIIPDPNSFDTAADIVKRYQCGRYDDVVVVAPHSVLNALCDAGLPRPLYAVMAEEHDPRKIETRGAHGGGYRFVEFRRVKSAAVVFEDQPVEPVKLQTEVRPKVWRGEVYQPLSTVPEEEEKARSRALLLAHVDQQLRKQCIAIAREKLPSAAFNGAQRAAMLAGLGQAQALGVAKATRWLAVVRRDYGLEKFEEAVRTLTA